MYICLMEIAETPHKKRILIAPLDWGLGHASRIVPIIKELLKQGHTLFLGTEKKTGVYLQKFFPELPQITLPSYGITYQSSGNIAFKLVLQTPKIAQAIFREHKILKQIVKQHAIDVVISDSRFGLWNKQAPSFILSHQLHISYPAKYWFFGRILNTVNRFFMNRFNGCLIPDTPEHLLSGKLSQNRKIKTQHFLGPLSRFTKSKTAKKSEQLVFVLSGPEPQRSIFEKIILTELKQTTHQALVVCGEPEKNYDTWITPKIRKVSHLNDKELKNALTEAHCVFSRSGYSSLMDYAVLQLKQVVLVPTPGQTEQMYLAEKFTKSKHCITQEQSSFSIEKALHNVSQAHGFDFDIGLTFLPSVLLSLLK